jgi:hypothetical protein
MSKSSVKNRIECLKNWAITYIKIKPKAAVKKEEY